MFGTADNPDMQSTLPLLVTRSHTTVSVPTWQLVVTHLSYIEINASIKKNIKP